MAARSGDAASPSDARACGRGAGTAGGVFGGGAVRGDAGAGGERRGGNDGAGRGVGEVAIRRSELPRVERLYGDCLRFVLRAPERSRAVMARSIAVFMK